MRRKDRERTSVNDINSVMNACDVLRIAFDEDGGPYVVPVNFAYTEEDGKYTFYIHGARAGKKYDLAKSGGPVGFEMDCNHRLIEDEVACGHTFKYSSIIGKGVISVVEDPQSKKTALQMVMKHYTGSAAWEMPEKMVNAAGIIKIEVTELTCKENS